MKTQLKLSIERDLVEQIKVYAQKQQTSVSDLVEEYFSKILRPAKKINVLDLIESLDKHDISNGLDLKVAYYEQRAVIDDI